MHNSDDPTNRQDLYRRKPELCRITENLIEQSGVCEGVGPHLEIGGANSLLRKYINGAVICDVVVTSELDIVCDATSLPFADKTFGSILIIDVLHHIANLKLFFDDCSRVLKDGGSLFIVDPYVSCSSFLPYKYLHKEGMEKYQNWLYPFSEDKLPTEGNQLILKSSIVRNVELFHDVFSSLEIVKIKYHCFFAYPLSGGFQSWSLLNLQMCSALLKFEEFLTNHLPWIAEKLAFRATVVIQRRSDV